MSSKYTNMDTNITHYILIAYGQLKKNKRLGKTSPCPKKEKKIQVVCDLQTAVMPQWLEGPRSHTH